MIQFISPDGDNFPQLLSFVDPYLEQIGLVGVSANLNRNQLIQGYRHGAFPWPVLAEELAEMPDLVPWFSPRERAVIDLSEMNVNARLSRAFRNSGLRFTFNSAFEEVILRCQAHWQPQTWITDEILRAYLDLHSIGLANSFECFNGSELVGGFYGVRCGKVFSAESMFRTESNTGKFCLVFARSVLTSLGIQYLDCQTPSKTAEHFGAKMMTRAAFSTLCLASGAE